MTYIPDAPTVSLADLYDDDTRWWLCVNSCTDDLNHATLVLGWLDMVRQFTADCFDFKVSPQAVLDVQGRMTRSPDNWQFGRDGTAQWHYPYETGSWTATLVTNASKIIAP